MTNLIIREINQNPTVIIGFGISPLVEYDSLKQKIKAIKNFADKGWVDCFYEVIDNRVFEITRSRGKPVQIKEIKDQELANRLIKSWKEAENFKLGYQDWSLVEELDPFYGRQEYNLFVPGFHRKPTKLVVSYGVGKEGFWTIAKNLEKTEELIGKNLNKFRESKSIPVLAQAFAIARKNRFVLGFLGFEKK